LVIGDFRFEELVAIINQHSSINNDSKINNREIDN